MTEEQLNSFQLKGEELEHMRKLVRAAEESLLQIAQLTHAKLNQEAGAARKHRHVKSARFYFNNLRVLIDDESGCEVFEDPPGICRSCKPGE